MSLSMTVHGDTIAELQANLAAALAGMGTAAGSVSANDAARIAGGTATVSAPKNKAKNKPAEAETDTGDEAETDPLEDGAGDEEQPTLDDVRNILVEARTAAGDKGGALVLEILKKLGAENLNKLDADKYADAIAEGKAAIAKYAKKKK